MPEDKELIRAEARLAVNGVITAHRGIAALKIRPEIRKAFPFGPGASEQEKEIWKEVVDEAVAHLEQWPAPIQEQNGGNDDDQ